ncbi:MAG TPA: DNA polymerase [Candidatus Paceibacterota bacterium]
MSEEKKQRKNVPRPFARKETRPRKKTIIAYDLETTNIKAGTPTPLYLTGYGQDGGFRVAERIDGYEDLCDVIVTNFLTEELNGARFVAWNGNNYDVYFIAKALLTDERYVMRPYMTRSKALRGMRVIDTKTEREWEFLDGMSMTGIMMPLEKFLKIFAPDHLKMSDAIDWGVEEFDYHKQSHCEYAMRDSVGLYYGMLKAESILTETFGQYLTPTIGNLGIKIFQSYLPKDVKVMPLPDDVEKIMRDYVMRGGFCFCAKKYTGPIWKYDLNQAYAAAMRDAWLPDGRANKVKQYWKRYPGIYRLHGHKKGNKIPFYYRDSDGDAVFGFEEITDTWLTSIEVEQLLSEGWNLKISEGYLFSARFRMNEYVDTLEHLRMNAEGGPAGAKGSMIKSIGNNSYGKTVEQLDGVEYVLAAECPIGYMPMPSGAVMSSDPGADISVEELPIFTKTNEPIKKDYHKPQIGAFITAHVRMVLRRAALIKPLSWLYGDTDCNAFSEPVDLDCHPSKYGKWKKEEQGEAFNIITKKVYAKIDPTQQKTFDEMTPAEKKEHLKNNKNVQHSKGLNVKKLTSKDFDNWINGKIPEQKQTHKNNFMKVLAGAEMFIERVRKGTKV